MPQNQKPQPGVKGDKNGPVLSEQQPPGRKGDDASKFGAQNGVGGDVNPERSGRGGNDGGVQPQRGGGSPTPGGAGSAGRQAG